MVALPSADVFALTAALVDIESESFNEKEIVATLESELRACAHLTVDRVGDNLIARTQLERQRRLVLGGHTDTVPVNQNLPARIEGSRLFGCGSTDMKGGVAIMLELARTVPDPAVDVTYVFYAREEVAARHNGLREIEAERPELLDGDVALLGEPTLGALEAGCQGTLRVKVTMAGARAHTARPWMGRNAIHRLGEVLVILTAYEGRRPVVEGCEYREALQAVDVGGGVAGNVVPDEAFVVINHRFAPDRNSAEAEAHVREVIAPALSEEDTVELTDLSPSARPGLGDPMIAALVERNQLEVRAKLGWTDVAFFAERGVPASNFGPGDPTIAHTQGEYLERENLLDTFRAVEDLLMNGA
ncbi:MAG: succinyl-diaminopimelate desuccinylase [Acidimicrobiales bacterium]|nr:succinyl-diaminopimelate desuccinylase [Acidimicrobiales bacterium]MDG2217761.1 succinyl-diaminopimelate desuccinylase [Acidimicrobiales bacterium]